MKQLVPYQYHPDPRLQIYWDGIQLAVVVMPFSSLLGSVGISLISLILFRQQFQTIARRPLNWGLLAVSLLMVVSAALARYPTEAWLGLANFLPFFIIFAALSELIQTPVQLRRLAWILVLASVPVVVIGLGEQFFGWTGRVQVLGSVVNWMIYPTGNPPGRMSSIFFYANVLASYLLVPFILSLGLLVEVIQQNQDIRVKKPQHRSLCRPSPAAVLLALIALGNGIALILTNSRNAWAIAILACFAFAVYLGWRWLVIGVVAIAGAILGAAFAPAPLREGLRRIVPPFFWMRLTDQLYPNRPLAELRTTQWKFAWSLVQERPWTGWGLRNFSPIYESHTQFFIGHPHNLVLMLAAETGLPATLLLVSLVGWVMVQGVLRLTSWQVDGTYPQVATARSPAPIPPVPEQSSTHSDSLILFTYLTAFMGCTLFSLLDITLFDVRINLFGWLLLSGISGLVYRPSNMVFCTKRFLH